MHAVDVVIYNGGDGHGDVTDNVVLFVIVAVAVMNTSIILIDCCSKMFPFLFV